LRDEYVIYSAHWDAYGRDLTRSGDQILNGAADNAIAVAMMLDIAQVAAAHPPKRSLVFFSPTYEEKGILGSKFYAENPLYPIERTAANLNIEPLDASPAYEPTRDLEIVGRNPSTIDDYAAEIAVAQGRVLRADSEAEKGYYYRSDHIEFAKAGVPAFFVRSGLDVIGVPPETGRQRRLSHLQNDYHKVSDEVRPDWTCAGAAHDAQFLLALGLRIANAATMPEWKSGTEFKAKRDAQLKASVQ
jgi:Zn-dependent M28 family amino/carboxypeptidase